ncbi:LexA family protein [Polaromonas sp. JS666]|uniref:LexA family protein n=1 Tax=Polaromonas sp. (strain JS666 / ATCC BAA-500) TaxID=296591 RepID=UPI0002F863A2|nr:S24 family peptidase [Polaromonas sp. JS666]
MTPVAASHAPMPVKRIRGTVKAGFPSPAEDLGAERLNLASLLGSDKEDAFFMMASGHSMVKFGIFDGDLLLIRKRKRPRDGHIVIADVDGEFLVKMLYKRAGQVKLVSGNPEIPDLEPKDGQTIRVWGVVTSSIKTFTA